jgi:transglutaminase-like putative cysteine protease
MKIFLKFMAVVILPLAFSCSDQHLINNPDYRKKVETDFKSRKELASNRKDVLFSVFDGRLSLKQKEALEFLYAYMPLNDLADYSGPFFLANVNASLHALNEQAWGKSIPEEIFLHYVLPYRINNENLDSFRIVCYKEIADRIKGLGMTDAALEINHWCHEKVSYQPADIRTSAPLSTMLSARGRCGEESTFTVAALRTAGIPARQVYTPRWAHTDDNHAWVEFWSDGKWHYFGACEPEAVVDRGWFTEPARRAMLIHTKSFGAPYGNENVIDSHERYSIVNNLAKYANTKTIYIKVLDKTGSPVQKADVEYQLYNYAEFYPLATVTSDENGISKFETGFGDLLIWAHNERGFGYKKITVAETDTLSIVLDKNAGETYSVELDLDPPMAPDPFTGPSKELAEKNSKRLDNENLKRAAYTDQWIKPYAVKDMAVSKHLDSTRLLNVFSRALGNYREIRSFLESIPDARLPEALDLLDVIADKDLRDTRAAILTDQLINTQIPGAGYNTEIFNDYVLNARIANEILSAWRGYFLTMLPEEIKKGAIADPIVIADYLKSNIKINDDENYYKTPITPIGVVQLKVSDAFSRDICFVAICRTLGIPARLEPGSLVPQYYLNSVWHDVFFPERTAPSGHKGFIRLASADSKPVPEYYVHFTLARFDKGRYNTLEYDYERRITDFRDELSLDPGSYMLVTGNRLSTGKILVSLAFFNLGVNEHKTVDVKIRRDQAESRILGNIDISSLKSLLNAGSKTAGIKSDKGFVIIWIDPDKEPTRHIFSDLPHLKKELDDWGGSFVFLTDPKLNWTGFSNDDLKRLPENTFSGNDRKLLEKTFNITDPDAVRFPFVVVSDSSGNIFYTSEGYKIGIGEQILKYAR